MERPIVENKIAKVLKSYRKGSVLFVDDFLDYGNPESVKKALLRGLDKRLSQKIKLPVHIAEDPLKSVVRGTGIALKHYQRFPFIMR